MWRLSCASNDKDNPFLASTQSFQGRQTWDFDPDAGTKEERDEVERLRAQFTKNRLTHKHSSDELLRMQQRSNLKVSSMCSMALLTDWQRCSCTIPRPRVRFKGLRGRSGSSARSLAYLVLDSRMHITHW